MRLNADTSESGDGDERCSANAAKSCIALHTTSTEEESESEGSERGEASEARGPAAGW